MAKGLETVGVWVAIGVMVGVAWIDFHTTEGLVETSRWVVHTQEVIQAFDDVLIATTAAGRARRSYWMTGDEAEADRTFSAIAHANAALEQVRALTVDNLQQQARWQTLKALIERRLDDVRQALEKQRSSDERDSVYEEAFSRRSNAQMTAVAAAIDSADAAERTLLAQRQESARRSANFAKMTGLFGTAIAIGIVAFAFARVRRENDRRVASERALRSSERFLDSIIENIPAMIFVKDASELRFRRVNRTGEALLGLQRDDLLGKSDYDFFPPDQASFFQQKDRQTLKEGVAVDILEEPIDTKAGTRWLHTKKVPIRGDDGQPRFLLGISEDVTEQKRTAEALRSAVAAAQNANRELEAFSYSVAHDLRAPLRAIDGFSQAILEDCADQLDDVGRGHLARVRASATRMADLIDGLLGLSRLARTEVRFESVDLSAIAAQIVEELRQQNQGRDVAVTIAPGLIVRGDPRILRVVVDNLLRNAFKFTANRPEACITFGATAATSGASNAGVRTFFVRDNGAGFDPRYKDKLFGAFQRLHDAREFPGTGIGLATVERAVKRHGGQVWAEGELGRGATFFFTLSESDTQEHAAE